MISPTPTTSKRVLARPRPSLKTNTQPPTSPIPPPLTSPMLSPASMLARKASFQQLTQNSTSQESPLEFSLSSLQSRNRVDHGKKAINGGDIEVGDVVDTPGGMHGVVKFIGSVRGKNGIFCGVELEGNIAGKGKNDGIVDGVRYFTTSTPMSGIFVPLSRATKRYSASSSSNAPPTPPLSSYSALSSSQGRRSDSPGPRTFGSSLGRSTGRPSLSRPESPVRRPPGGRPSLLPPTTPRNVSAGGSRLLAPSPTPGKPFERGRAGSVSLVNEPESRPGTSGGPPRLAPVPKQTGAQLGVKKGTNGFGMRSASAMDRRRVDEELTSPIDAPPMPPIDFVHTNNKDITVLNTTIATLEKKLAERERQLEEQNTSLNEMESTLVELQSLIGNAQNNVANSPQMVVGSMSMRNFEDADAEQLRAMLREKNAKIEQLTSEFDSHRADFRSTIDTLELASSETVRVYEKRLEDLMAENRELQERGEDVESVARQLKQLEELVAELEEGLEDARRGEAEARGEVEFLRGEVERCREELRREKEKSAAAVANAAVGSMMRNNTAEELEKKDEEIRGLKAIIHSLSQESVSDDERDAQRGTQVNGKRSVDGSSNGVSRGASRAEDHSHHEEELAKERELREKLEQRIKLLEAEVKTKTEREAQLEREIELMERERRNSVISEKPPKTNSVYSVASEKAFQELTKPVSSLNSAMANMEVRDSFTKESARDSKGTVASWRSANSGDENAQTGGRSSTVDDSDADQDPENLWCEICETAGHDILTCTSMFGSSGGRPAIEGPGDKLDTSVPTPIDTEAPVAPLSIKSASPIDGPDHQDISISPTATRKKSVHLPPPPPMVDGIGPVAGKESGVIDDSKWCALCERDGHDSVDCPFDDAF
ncbi:hypothetical protein BDZ91DRAFT_55178 [Kalaharituber pfeilii]|nr:hypothetical protein BDZ91DRAFT_55178 [Kalaharituber pfeilii]